MVKKTSNLTALIKELINNTTGSKLLQRIYFCSHGEQCLQPQNILLLLLITTAFNTVLITLTIWHANKRLSNSETSVENKSGEDPYVNAHT